VAYCEITYERDGPKARTAVHGPLGITYHLNEKAKAVADCLENQFTSHNLCDVNRKRRVETRVQALLVSVDDTPLRKVGLSDFHKLSNSLKLRKACGFDGIPNGCLSHLLRRPLVHLTHLFTTPCGCPIFQSLGRKQKL
jgi:hypothetical protein